MSAFSKNNFPATPPQTPPTNKDGKLNRGRRPTGIYTALSNAPPLTPDASPHPGYSVSPTLLSPDDLPGAGSGTIGLGLGFAGGVFNDRSYSIGLEEVAGLPVSVSEDKQEKRKKRPTPVSQFSSAKTRTRGYLANPYREEKQPIATTLSSLVRVPRRMRPVLLFATSLLVFGIILISRSAAAASEASRLSQMIRNAESRTLAPFGRDYVHAKHVAGQHVIPHESRITQHRVQPPKVQQPSIKLSAHDELLALIGFITGATGNSLPPTVDPSVPIEPSVLLGFDPTDSSAHQDLELLKDEVNTQYPLVLMGRMRDPWNIEVVRMLDEYKISPKPLIIDVDQRRDHILFIPVVARLLETDELPQLLLQGQRLGSAQELVGMDEAELKAKLTSTHALTMRRLSKKEKKGHGHGKDGKMKAERERLLAPAPIVVE